ncbi:hypothetical protein [Streptomyces sp. DH24]|uniref:FtsB family cell division protein n=1 Tax=Streptomyces sp. DH24 TaxID=3040123 RepID=UPI0024426EBD|nr:hypothetical protein [Streptomyces sp. DH24]MDG9715347.1 hypothetical protein [Streptomyces sp. DH24]
MGRKPELRGRAARLAQLLPTGQVGQAARTPFVLLVVLLLGGGLIGLLVLNSALSEGSFRLDDLERQTQDLTDEEQALQRDVDAYSAPDALQRRARELGMVPGGDPAFLGPDGKVKGVPSPAFGTQTASRTPLILPPRAMPAEGPAATPTAPAPPVSTPPAGAPAPAATDPAPAATDPAPAATGLAAPTPSPAQPATTSTPGR